MVVVRMLNNMIASTKTKLNRVKLARIVSILSMQIREAQVVRT